MGSRRPMPGPGTGNVPGMLRECRLCPRECRVDRLAGETGYCGAGAEAKVAAVSLHHGEEPPISGSRGSGTVFFSHCNMRCLFCQNYPISQLGNGRVMCVEELGDRLLDLQAKGAHNINFVTPTPHVPHLIKAVRHARGKGLSIPIVYNTNGYDSLEALALLDGTVDIYLPDAKYRSERYAGILSDSPGYPGHNDRAIAEMLRQVGPLTLDRDGIAVRGVLIRHLVLPGKIGETRKVLRHLRETFGTEVPLSLMGQYFPAWRAASLRSGSPFARKLSPEEYAEAIDIALELGLENTFIQDDPEPVVRAR
ncbi:MAG: radical SAM protein [Deltaproteobacteria bacterium]